MIRHDFSRVSPFNDAFKRTVSYAKQHKLLSCDSKPAIYQTNCLSAIDVNLDFNSHSHSMMSWSDICTNIRHPARVSSVKHNTLRLCYCNQKTFLWFTERVCDFCAKRVISNFYGMKCVLFVRPGKLIRVL